MSEIRIGDKVEYLDHAFRELFPETHPEPGTIGTVIDKNGVGLLVQWPEGSTSEDDRWWVTSSKVRRVES